MASNSGWTTGLPSGQSKVSTTDEEFRSFKSFVQAWLEEEHYVTQGSAASAGILKKGGGRAFVGPSSQLSNPTADNDGRFFWATDIETLFVAQASSSSWSRVEDNVQLTSDQTWTGDQQIGDGTDGELILDPPDGDWKVLGVVSGISRFGANLGIAAGISTSIDLRNPNSALTYGDPIFVSSADSGGVFGASVLLSASVVPSSGSVRVILHNAEVSRVTFNSGTTIRFVGFKSS